MQGLHSMALQLQQGGMRGRQRLVGGTLAGTHRGPDAGVSEEAQAAVEGTQVAVHCMPEGSTCIRCNYTSMNSGSSKQAELENYPCRE